MTSTLNYKRTYEKLVKQFPLRPIRTEEQNDQAAIICDSLTTRINKLSQAERDYLEVLTDLIAKFELRWDDETSDMNPRELIGYIMQQNDLTQADLVTEFGSASRASEFLNGKRKLSLSQAVKLSRRFKLELTALIETPKSARIA